MTSAAFRPRLGSDSVPDPAPLRHLVAARFRERRVEPSVEVVDALARDTYGVRALVDAACEAYADGSCRDPIPGLKSAREAARERLDDLVDSSWRPVIDYLAVAGDSAPEEVEALDLSDVLSVLATARIVVRCEQQGEERVSLAPAVRAAAYERLRPDQIAELRRTVVRLRSEGGFGDFGLTACAALGDSTATARLLGRIPARVAFGPHRDRYLELLSSLPLEAAADHLALGHRLELVGRLPLGTTPVPARQDREAIEGSSTTDRDLLFMTSTFAAMASRRRWEPGSAAARVARASAPAVARVLRCRTARGGPQAFASLWYLHAGMSCQLGGHPRAARAFYREAWRFRGADDSGLAAAGAAAHLALLGAAEGDSAMARRWLDRRDETTIAPEVDSGTAWEVGQIGALARTILATDALEVGEAVTPPAAPRPETWDAWLGFATWAAARAAITEGRADQVERIVAEALGLDRQGTGGSEVEEGLLAEVRAEAFLALGSPHKASAALADLPAESVYGRSVRARLSLVGESPARARDLAASRRGQHDTRTRDIAELMVIEGAAHLELGKGREAHAVLTHALELIAKSRNHRVLAVLPDVVVDHLADHEADLPPLGDAVLGAIRSPLRPLYPTLSSVRLSPREIEVLQGLAAHDSLAKIAADRWVTRNTIKSQVRSIYRKLGVNTRHDAVRVAHELGLFDSARPSVPLLPEQRTGR